nr:hypothetical protein [Pseudomonas sp.]
MTKFFAVIFAVAGLALGGSIVGLQAQEATSACTTPGTAPLAGVTDNARSLIPSQSRLIAGYGRGAKVGGCKISLVCVATDGSEAARELARKQCVAVRDSLVWGGFVKGDISTSRRNPGGGMAAGMVYLSAY